MVLYALDEHLIGGRCWVGANLSYRGNGLDNRGFVDYVMEKKQLRLLGVLLILGFAGSSSCVLWMLLGKVVHVLGHCHRSGMVIRQTFLS